MAFVLSAVALIGGAEPVSGEVPGRLDPSFNEGGTGAEGFARIAFAYPDGRLMLQGTFTRYNGVDRAKLARLNPNGSLDESFNAGTAGETFQTHGAALLPDGKVLVFGNFDLFNGVSRMALVRLNSDGSVDETFDAKFTNARALGNVYRVVVQPDGKVIIAGQFTFPGEQVVRNLARLNLDGSRDTSFEAAVSVYENGVRALVLQPEGRIVVGGDVYESVTKTSTVFRLLPDGSKDESFKPSYPYMNSWKLTAMAFQPDGKIIVGGNQFVRRLEANGTEDSTFVVPSSTTIATFPNCIVVQPDGKLLIGGQFARGGWGDGSGYGRLNRDGSLDTGFDINGAGTGTQLASVVTLSDSGLITMSGGFPSPLRIYGGEPLAAGSGTLRFGFGSVLVNEADGVAKVAIVRDGGNGDALTVDYTVTEGSAVAGSDFTGASGSVTFAAGESVKLVTFSLLNDSTAEEVETFTVSLNTGSESISTTVTILDDDSAGRLEWRPYTLQVGEGNTKVTLVVTRNGETKGAITAAYVALSGTAEVGLDVKALSGSLAFADGENYKTVELEILDDLQSEGSESLTLLLSSPTEGVSIGTGGTALITILDNDSPGALRRDFTAGVHTSSTGSSVTRCAVETSDGKLLVGGSFGIYGGVNSRAIVKLNAYGAVDPSFTSPFSGTAAVAQIAVLPTGKFLVRGTNLRTDTLFRKDLVRLNPDGSLDETFNPGPAKGTVNVFALQPDGKILVAGAFSEVGGGVQNNFARLFPDGSLDTSFAVNFAPDSIAALAVQADGRIIAAGDFSRFSQVDRAGIARVHTGGELDEEFVPDPAFNVHFNRVKAVALQPDGYILIGGELAFTDRPGKMLLRLTPTGAVDPSFTPAERGYQSFHYVDAIYLQQDGRVVVSGSFTNIGGMERPSFARLFPDGSGDTTFEVYLSAAPLGLLTNGDLLVSVRVSNVTTVNRMIGGHLDVPSSGSVRFAWTHVGVNETGGSALLCLTRDGGNLTPVSVDVSTVDGSAVAGVDFIQFVGTITFAAQETTKTIRIPVLDNTTTEGARQFMVTLSNATGGAVIGSNAVATVTISDSERPGHLQLATATLEARESQAGLQVLIKRTLGSQGRVTVDLKTVQGNAIAGADFEPVSTTVVFEPGVLEQTVTVPVIKDGVSEGDETFSVVLSNPKGGAVLSGSSPTTATVTLIDIDDPGSLDEDFIHGFTPGTEVQAVLEQPDGKLVVALSAGKLHEIKRLHRSGLVDQGFQTVSLDARVRAMALQPDGKIIVGGDFSRVGATFLRALIRLHSDGSLDPSFETPALESLGSLGRVEALGLQSDGKVVLGGTFSTVASQPQQFLARLNPNGSFDDTYRPEIDPKQGSVSKLLVTPDDKTIYLSQQSRLQQILVDGTVDSNFSTSFLSFYLNPSISCFCSDARGRILVGGSFDRVNSAFRKNLVRLLPDGKVDTSFDAGTLFSNPPAAITIQADEQILIGRGVQGPADHSVVRLKPNGQRDEVFRPLNRGPLLLRGLIVLSNNTVLAYGTVGTLDGAPVSGMGRLLLGPQPGAFRFSNAMHESAENGGAVSLTVERYGGSDGETWLAYSTHGGTAEAGADFIAISGEIRFAAGETSKVITIPLVDDSTWELNEDFSVRLSIVVGGGLIAEGSNPKTVTITDDDPMLRGTLGFAETAAEVEESAARVVLAVHRTDGSDGAAEVGYRTVEGGARAGLDYVPEEGTLRFEHGETTKEIILGLINNSLKEAAKTFTVELFGATGAAIGSAGTATVTITDADIATIDAFRGTYRGLVNRAGNLHGSIVVSMQKRGRATATVILNGRRYVFRGTFDAYGSFNGSIRVKGNEPFLLQIQADQLGNLVGRLSGILQIGETSYQVTADKTPYNSGKPAPMSGQYNCVLEPAEDNATAPRGVGFATVTVAKGGSVRVVGMLADGTKVSRGTNVASDDSWAMFLPGYGSGGVSGTMQFAQKGDVWDMEGTGYWTKPERPKDRFYPAGFTAELRITGSPQPPMGAPLLDFTEGQIALTDSAFSLERNVSISSGSRLLFEAGAEKLGLSVNRKAGTITGSFWPAGGKKPVRIRASILSDEKRAAGYFLGPHGSGEFRLEPLSPEVN